MLRNLFRITKPLISLSFPQFHNARPLFSPKILRNFADNNQGKIALAEHHKQIRLMQYLSTKMEMPPNVERVDIKVWEEKGLLGSMKEHSKGLEIYEAVNVPDIPGANTPTGSWIRFKYSLEKDVGLRDHFQRFYSEGIRVGRILEIMDYLAGTVAYRYCKEDPKAKKVTMATASVNDVEIFESQIKSSKDLLLTGYVCHVGKTSLEIRVDISHSENPDDQAGAAYFMFVARDANDYKKSYLLPQLSFEGESNPKKCLLRDQYGKRNKERRKAFADKSLFKVPPSSEESVELHNLFKKTLDSMAVAEYFPIHKTQHEKLMLMHVQDKNRHGKVFGGYVMREATELAWVTAFLNSNGGYPQYVHIDDVTFVRPIPVGSITRFRSFLSYTEDSLMHVEVVADNLKDNNQEERVFEVNVTFAVETTPKRVIPCTYSDGMLYLEGKRRVNNFYTS